MPESAGLIFLTSLLVAFSGALIPGPMLAADIGESARSGFRAGPLLITGHAVAELLLVVALLLGLNKVVTLPWLSAMVSLLGGLFLFWMAANMIREGRKREDGFAAAIEKSGSRHHRTILSGILLSILNPTWLVWWATIGVTFVVWSVRYGALGPVYFYTGHILADFSWYSFVSFMVARGRRLSHALHRWLLLGSGTFLLLLGGYFVWQGARFWLSGD